jgi:RND family efflux transporter MFP subunit
MDRRMKRIAIGVGAVLLAGFVLVEAIKLVSGYRLSRQAEADAAAPPLVNVVTVSAPKGGQPLTLPGETAAWYESTIYARVSGYVAKWNVDIGDHVAQGQVLAEIETPDLDAELAAARAKLKAAMADEQVRQAEADFARSTDQRWRDSPKGVVSEQERDDKRAGDAGAAARLAAAQAQVNLDQADVDRLTAFAAFKQVTAPYDGTITERRIDIGNLVTAGSSSSTTLLYRMAKDDIIRVFVDAPQSTAGDLMKAGVVARISANSLPNRTFEGKITRTSEAMEPKARTFRVEVDIPNADHALYPGMYVDAAFQLPDANVVRIPAAALMFKASGPQVALVADDGTVRFRPVTIARDEGSVVDLSAGVAAGDRVALNLSSQVTDGSKVTTGGVEVTRLSGDQSAKAR